MKIEHFILMMNIETDEEIEYKEEGPIWKGKNYINTNGIHKRWYDNMMRCDKLPAENYLLIDYFDN